MIPTAEEFLKINFEGSAINPIILIEFAQLHVEAALLKAKEIYLLNEANMSECPLYLADTIINAYPKELIK